MVVVVNTGWAEEPKRKYVSWLCCATRRHAQACENTFLQFSLIRSKHKDYHQVGLWPCHGQGGNQYWLLSKEGELRRDEACLDFGGGGVKIKISVTHIITISCHHHHTIYLLNTGCFFNWPPREFAKCWRVSNRFRKNVIVPDCPPPHDWKKSKCLRTSMWFSYLKDLGGASRGIFRKRVSLAAALRAEQGSFVRGKDSLGKISEP